MSSWCSLALDFPNHPIYPDNSESSIFAAYTASVTSEITLDEMCTVCSSSLKASQRSLSKSFISGDHDTEHALKIYPWYPGLCLRWFYFVGRGYRSWKKGWLSQLYRLGSRSPLRFQMFSLICTKHNGEMRWMLELLMKVDQPQGQSLEDELLSLELWTVVPCQSPHPPRDPPWLPLLHFLYGLHLVGLP